MVDLTHPVALGYGGPVPSAGPEKTNPLLSMGSGRAARQSQGPVQMEVMSYLPMALGTGKCLGLGPFYSEQQR